MTPGPDEIIVRWLDDPGGLALEECARRGIEAVAGFVIGRDVFGTNNYPDAHFCTCAKLSHIVTGAAGNRDDHIGVGFHVVDIRDGTYPMVGAESVRMIMQPLGDGSVSARWDPVADGSISGEISDPGQMVRDLDNRSSVCRPMALGEIPEQDAEDHAQPAFLFLKDPGAGWQIWRRFSPEGGDGEPVIEGGCREEIFTMVYPFLSSHMNWRFRVYDLPDGGLRWEVNSGIRR